jgi:hypothetical protein
MGIFICGEVAKHYVLRVPRMRALARKHREQKKRSGQYAVLVVLFWVAVGLNPQA